MNRLHSEPTQVARLPAVVSVSFEVVAMFSEEVLESVPEQSLGFPNQLSTLLEPSSAHAGSSHNKPNGGSSP